MSGYRIRPARTDDLPGILGLRQEAEQWMAAAGIRQWTPDYAEYAHDVFVGWVASGAAWVVDTDEGELAATVSVNTEPDLDFWGWLPARNGEHDEIHAALYLGKMIVARKHAGRHLGEAILNWATRRARATGRTWIRLDVRRDNIALQRYYLDRGFRHVRTYHAPGRRTESGWLAQRHVQVVTDAGGLALSEAAGLTSATSRGG